MRAVAEAGGSVAPPLPRRAAMLRLARAAGLTVPVLGFLEGRVAALPRGEETDIAVLHAALALEHEAIAIYDVGLKRSLFPPGLRSYAVEFRGDHQGHRDTQIAITEERGSRPPDPRPGYALAPLTNGDAVLRQAVEIELAAQDAYTALISQIRTRDYLLSAAFILVDEVRHLTVWRRVLGLKIY
jgi:rubrerythrin